VTGLPESSRLAQIATELSGQHAACESALSDALGHASRAGELLLEAKPLVAYGEWGSWLAANFAGSHRTARGYMQLARERRPVATVGVRAALAAIAEPHADEEPEVVDAEPVPEPAPSAGGPDVVDLIRTAGGLHEAEQDLAEVDARRARERFPRTGVEATTVRQVREALKRGERLFAEAIRAGHAGISDWSCGQCLAEAATQYRDVADALAELAKTLDRKAREV
jgi:hypothetical protein